MTLCPSCGMQNAERELCWHHTQVFIGNDENEWSRANRIWCDYFHRGKMIERVDDFSDVVVPVDYGD